MPTALAISAVNDAFWKLIDCEQLHWYLIGVLPLFDTGSDTGSHLKNQLAPFATSDAV